MNHLRLVLTLSAAFLATGCAGTREVVTGKTSAAANGVVVLSQSSACSQKDAGNVLAMESCVEKDLTSCIDAVTTAKPGTYVARTQLLNRTTLGAGGAVAMYGLICYWTGGGCSYVWEMGAAMGAYILGMSVGDWDTDKARYAHNDLSYCMTLKGWDGGYTAILTEDVAAGKARVVRIGPQSKEPPPAPPRK